MRIGIISDTHNQKENLKLAMDIFQQERIDLLFHCGDLTDIELVPMLDVFQTIFVYGNMDKYTGEIRQLLLKQNPKNFAGSLYTGDIGGRKIAATHGDAKGQIFGLVNSEKYDYIFHGHTHQFRDEKNKNTRLINPGALGGKQVEPRSICTLDIQNGNLKHIILNG